MGFMAVSGLSVNNEVIPYREGGNNTTTKKMPGQSDFGPIVCTRGLASTPASTSGSTQNAGTNEIYEWFTQIFAVGAGGGFGQNQTNFRVGVTIDVLGHPFTVSGFAVGVDQPPMIKARFQVYNAWPMGYALSDLEAGGNAVLVENLTLAHEGWNLQVAPNDETTYINSSLQI
jgi:phage tail-like protein